MQAGEFTPTAHSKVTYNEAFRAINMPESAPCPSTSSSSLFNYAENFMDLYPSFPIKKDEYGQAYYGKAFKNSNILEKFH